MSNATGTFSIRERPHHLAKEEALSISTARTSHRNSFRNSAGTDHARSFFLCGGGELFILQSSAEWGQAPRGFPPRSRSRTRHLSRPRASLAPPEVCAAADAILPLLWNLDTTTDGDVVIDTGSAGPMPADN